MPMPRFTLDCIDCGVLFRVQNRKPRLPLCLKCRILRSCGERKREESVL